MEKIKIILVDDHQLVRDGIKALLTGIPDIYIGEKLCEDESVEMLPHIAIDEQTLSLNFLVNDSPFAGQEGKFVSSRQLKERLEKEILGWKGDLEQVDDILFIGTKIPLN